MKSLRMRLRGRATPPQGTTATVSALLELSRRGPTPLTPGGPGAAAPLSIATVIPSFRRGSGGHMTIVHLLKGLSARGHSVSIWLEDCEGRHASESPALIKRSFREFFGPEEELELHTDFDGWQGADLVLATGWQTVARTLMLVGAHARAYLVQDHEPDFYPASAESTWAAQTYRQGLHCIAASPWLAALLRTRYGAEATHFDLGVDLELYAERKEPREQDLVVFYARAVTPRRAVPIGLLALQELSRQRPNTQIALYGEDRAASVRFEHRNLGLLDGSTLAELYSRASVGVVLSLTNPSLIGLEMMACGLPCVELANEPMLASFGKDGPLKLAAPDPHAICAAVESLLDDPARRARLSRAGLELMSERTWEHAAGQVEIGLRAAIASAAGLAAGDHSSGQAQQ